MLSDSDLQRAIDERGARAEIPASSLTEAVLARIARIDPQLSAFITVTPELAHADAERVDAARARGTRLPLDGMPIALKDNIDVGGVRCTVGSHHFEDRISENDAPVVTRLREAGAIVVGKAHMHEFAYGVTSDSALGTCRNAWDRSRIPGGSSGGSGALVAADLAIAALGTDTGGSVRLPAGFNGITGLRPTHGAVSNRGVFPLAPSFDTVGPLARSARDVRDVFTVMAGYDPGDPWSQQTPFAASRTGGAAGMRIAMVEPWILEGADPEIVELVRAAASAFEALGATVVPLGLDGIEDAYKSCALMTRAEGAATFASVLDEGADLVGPDIRERLLLGRNVTGPAFAAMLDQMMHWRRTLALAFAGVDLLLTPTIAIPTPVIEGLDTLAVAAQLTRMTSPWSFAGTPAISLPCGFRSDGMPVGIQLIAAPWNDYAALDAAEAYQSHTSWHLRRPAFA